MTAVFISNQMEHYVLKLDSVKGIPRVCVNIIIQQNLMNLSPSIMFCKPIMTTFPVLVGNLTNVSTCDHPLTPPSTHPFWSYHNYFFTDSIHLPYKTLKETFILSPKSRCWQKILVQITFFLKYPSVEHSQKPPPTTSPQPPEKTLGLVKPNHRTLKTNIKDKKLLQFILTSEENTLQNRFVNKCRKFAIWILFAPFTYLNFRDPPHQRTMWVSIIQQVTWQHQYISRDIIDSDTDFSRTVS